MLLPIVEGISISSEFGQVVRDLREKRGLSQEELADRSGLHRNAVGLIERGQRIPSVETLFALSYGLGIKASTLVAKLEANPASQFWIPNK